MFLTKTNRPGSKTLHHSGSVYNSESWFDKISDNTRWLKRHAQRQGIRFTGAQQVLVPLSGSMISVAITTPATKKIK